MTVSSLLPRSDYPTLESAVYLNQAALGLIGRPAVEAMHAFLDGVARHGNRFMSDADEASFGEALRARAARLLNAEAEHIAVVAGASELLGQLPYLLEPDADSTVVAIGSDFPAITRPWLRRAGRCGCRVRFVDDRPTEDLTDALIDALDEQTSVLAVSHVQYATGSAVNIPRLRQATSEVGAHLIVDVSQSAGAMTVDATAWDADLVVSSGYKWLGAHGGVALAAVSERLLHDAPPLPGWMGAADPFDFDARSLSVAADASRFTQSTMSYVSLVGLTAALDQLLSLGAARIEAHSGELASLLVDALAASGWRPFRPPADASASTHILSIGHRTRSDEAYAELLRAQSIICGVRGGRIRVSLAPYNDESDVRALIEALRAAG